jgi:hypothetical protein
MRSLSASELVEVWERGLGQHPVERALTLLIRCGTDTREQLAALSIGRRDLRLLQVYECLFGPTIEAFAECPACEERLEYSLAIGELMVQPVPEEVAELTLVATEVSLRLRLPNSSDLRAVIPCADIAAARQILLERCILEASKGGKAVPVETLPEQVVQTIAARLAGADPQAEMLVELCCAGCRHRWQVILDIEYFLWAKISALAKRLLREVHALARAYGWCESDILRLSALRRQSYLELVGS